MQRTPSPRLKSLLFLKSMKGEISITTALIGAAGMIIVALVGSWTTASSKVSSVEIKVAEITERENNHYEEVQKQLGVIDGNIKILMQAQGLKITKP